MANKYKDRIKILEEHEIDELYGLPKFNADERAYYFSLTQKEQEIAQSHRTQENRVLFILQIGYFKAKTMFFSFVFSEVHHDVQYVLRQYFPLSGDIRLSEAILRQTKHTQQQKILELYGYRVCRTDERTKLIEKALQSFRNDFKLSRESSLGKISFDAYCYASSESAGCTMP